MFLLCLGLMELAPACTVSSNPTFQNASSDTVVTQFPVHHDTKYFEFHLQRDSPQNAQTISLSDNFVEIVKHQFFNSERGYPIRVFISEDEGSFIQFMHHDLGIQDPADFGIYVFSRKVLATYEQSGLGTFTHETMHPLVEENLLHRPAWAMEGIPSFFEKFYGYRSSSGLVLYWGFQNPWRIRSLGPDLTKLDLAKIVSENGAPEQNESKLRMAAVFLWDQGKLRRFLRLVAANDRVGYPTFFEAAMGMPMEKILTIWHSYLQNIDQNRPEILSLPVSTVLRNEAEFQEFVRVHRISTYQIKQVD